MTDLPTLIKQSKDLERKIKKIKTRNANRDLIDKRKTLEVQIDQQTQKTQRYRQQHRVLPKADAGCVRSDLEVVLKLLDEKNEKKSFTEFRKLRRARKQVMEMEKLLDDFNKKSQDKFGWQVGLPPTFENDKAVEIFLTKMAEKLEDMKAKKQSHQLS
ncbi:hypothetical protein D6D01_06961 [Aureobasidium pullulans]|uniref:Uncharacterized protein n=1 Tax=Aureobasidium pullulans TaxID=5580 RepID=A0A4S9KTU0_AURPU|nr:hypothetical protein D6D01_06961 [Aureobasidium pullulans]